MKVKVEKTILLHLLLQKVSICQQFYFALLMSSNTLFVPSSFMSSIVLQMRLQKVTSAHTSASTFIACDAFSILKRTTTLSLFSTSIQSYYQHSQLCYPILHTDANRCLNCIIRYIDQLNFKFIFCIPKKLQLLLQALSLVRLLL